MNKKGLSPVVATALLIVLVIIIALIIFMWAKGFLKEQVVKFGEPIETACGDISFSADISGGVLSLTNRGNVPIKGFELYKVDSGSRQLLNKQSCPGGKDLGAGESCEITGIGVNAGQEILVVPILLGQKGEQEADYTCQSSGKGMVAS